MATLTAASRNRMASSTFGLPGSRSYPMPDRSHAANAKARAAQQLKAGNLSRSEYDRIVAKANSILRDGAVGAGFAGARKARGR